MIRNTSPGRKLLVAGIVLALGMTGCGTGQEITLTGTEVTGTEEIGIEAVAAMNSVSAEATVTGENALEGAADTADVGAAV